MKKHKLKKGEKLFRVNYPEFSPDWSALFAVKTSDTKTVLLCKEVNEFWGDHLLRTERNLGDQVKAALEVIGPALLEVSMVRGSLSGMIEMMAGREGMPRLDGSCGIRLIDCDEYQFDHDFGVEEVTL